VSKKGNYNDSDCDPRDVKIDLEATGNRKLSFEDKESILKLQYDMWEDFSKNKDFSEEDWQKYDKLREDIEPKIKRLKFLTEGSEGNYSIHYSATTLKPGSHPIKPKIKKDKIQFLVENVNDSTSALEWIT